MNPEFFKIYVANQLIRSVTEGVISCENNLAGLEVPGCGKMVFDQENHNPEVTLVTTQATREYLAHLWKQYKTASRALKMAILDEVVRNCGMHRKSAVRIMRSNHPPRAFQGYKGGRKRQYSNRAKEHLVRLWKTMGYICPERLKPALPEWLPHDLHKDCDAGVKSELLAMSISTIRRYLEKSRAELQRKMNTGTKRGVKKFIAKVPIRNLGEQPTELGHCEIDCVAHCGGSLSGEFAWTLTVTDLISGWTECEAVWAKDAFHICQALRLIEKRLPFSLKALYCDNGSEFMNDGLVEKFAKAGRKTPIKVFRSRPYKKNDQAHVEQKNYTHVRHLFGYGRIDWKPSVGQMNDIYRKEWRALQNFYLPQQKLIEKQRIGSKIRRKMSIAETPFTRLTRLLSEAEVKRLTNEKALHCPFRLRHNQRLKVKKLNSYYKHNVPKEQWGRMAI